MKKQKRGFTLIELLVVVLIIGILAAVAVPQYEVAVAKSRYTQLLSLVDACEQAQQIYHLANGEYADNFEALDIEMPSGTMNNTKNRITYPYFSIDVTSQYCTGSLTSTGYNLTYHHYMTGRRDCRSNSDLGQKICKAMGGTNKAGHSNHTFFLAN